MNYYFTYGLLIPLLASILLIIILYSQNKKSKKLVEKLIFEKHDLETLRKEEIKDYFKEEWEQEKQKIDYERKVHESNVTNQINQLENKYKLDASKYEGQLKQLDVKLQEKEKRYNEVNQDLNLYREGKMKEIDGTAAEYEQRKRQAIDHAIEEHKLSLQQQSGQLQKELQEQEDKLKSEIETIKSELETERSKRAAINEEIRKQEEKEKYNEIHSVQLTANEKEDIHFLLSLEERLHNKQALYKLVWSTYLQQAYKNTFHNILGNRDPRNVIYCIENINTGKKYIGKTSAEVSKRWTEHIKTSLNIGSIKTTNIHKALYNHWDEFIFYILAETEKEKLSEMEKYYINFYESDKYGYNIKAGG